MEWSSSKMKYESNCCTSGSIYDPWSSSLCWQTLILAGAGMVLHFFLISGWFMPSFGTWKPSDGLAHFHLDRAVTGVTCQSFSFDNWPALTAFCLAWRRGSTGNTHSKPGPVIRSTPTSGVTFHHVTVQPCSVTWSLGIRLTAMPSQATFIFLEPQARHAVLVLHVVRSPPRVFLSETRSCCIWICFGQERWLGSAGICSTVLMSRWYRVDESHLAAWQREKWDNNMFKNNNKRLNLYIKRFINVKSCKPTALIYLYLL